jgi:hypothetical protein
LGILHLIALADLRGLRVREPHNLDGFRHGSRQSQILPIKALEALQKIRTLRSAFTNFL